MPLDPHLLLLFLPAVMLLVITPGPDSMLVLSRATFEGRDAGMTTALGVTAGAFVHSLLAAFGISALIAESPALFGALKTAGAVYLGWLGLRAIRAALRLWRARGAAAIAQPRRLSRAMTFRHALLTNLLNPKVVLFFLAFIPQFVSPAAGPVGLQIFLLGALLGILALVYHWALTAAAVGASARLLTRPKVRALLDGASGLVFIAFAAKIFFTERRVA